MNPKPPIMVKVCGMRSPDNIRAVEALGIDLMGFIFWPTSSRYVHERPAYLPTHCRRVGVFVNEAIDTVRRIADDYALDIIQLHGSESPEYVSQLHERPVIKAFNIATPDDFAQTTAYEGLADTFLFDAKGRSVGGNGIPFDWTVLSSYHGSTPYLLSGGIGPDDAPRLRSFFRAFASPVSASASPLPAAFSVGSGSAAAMPPASVNPPCPQGPVGSGISAVKSPAAKCLGIDLNSRFETEPALKDPVLLRRFLSQLSHQPH